MKCQKCGIGDLIRAQDGMEGSFCNHCNEWSDYEPPVTVNGVDIASIYDPERIKAIRGIPYTELSFGSETKGRLKASIPAFCSKEEAHALIDMQIEYLKYALARVQSEGLDIFTKPKAKD